MSPILSETLIVYEIYCIIHSIQSVLFDLKNVSLSECDNVDAQDKNEPMKAREDQWEETVRSHWYKQQWAHTVDTCDEQPLRLTLPHTGRGGGGNC